MDAQQMPYPESGRELICTYGLHGDLPVQQPPWETGWEAFVFVKPFGECKP